MKRIKDILLNKNIIMCYVLFSISMTATFFPAGLTKFLVWSSFAWALIYVVYMIATDFELLKTNFRRQAMTFIVIAAVTALITLLRDRNIAVFVDNIQIVISYLVYMFFLMIPDKKQNGNETFKVLCWALLGVYLIPVIMSGVQAVFNIYIDFKYTPHGYIAWRGRYYTLFSSPNGYSSMCVLVVCAIMLVKKNLKNKILKTALTVYQICAVLTIGMCASRGVMVSTVAGIMVYNILPFIKDGVKNLSIITGRIVKGMSVAFIVAVYMYFSCDYIGNIVPMLQFKIDNFNKQQIIQETSSASQQQETTAVATAAEPSGALSSIQQTKEPVLQTTTKTNETAENTKKPLQTQETAANTTEKPSETESVTAAETTAANIYSEAATSVKTEEQYTFQEVRDYYEHGPDVSNGRFEKWMYAIKAVAKRPLFGYSLYGEGSISCHNMYFTTLLSYGIIGFTAFMWLIISCMKNAVIKYKKCGMGNEKEYRTMLSILAGILVCGLTGDILIYTYVAVNIVFYVILGIMNREEETMD